MRLRLAAALGRVPDQRVAVIGRAAPDRLPRPFLTQGVVAEELGRAEGQLTPRYPCVVCLCEPLAVTASPSELGPTTARNFVTPARHSESRLCSSRLEWCGTSQSLTSGRPDDSKAPSCAIPPKAMIAPNLGPVATS